MDGWTWTHWHSNLSFYVIFLPDMPTQGPSWERPACHGIFTTEAQLTTHIWPNIPWHWPDCLSILWIDGVLRQRGRSNSSRHASSPWQRCWPSYDGRQWPCRREKDSTLLYLVYHFLQFSPNHLAIKAASDYWNLSFWCWICCYEAWYQNAEGTEIYDPYDKFTFVWAHLRLWWQ